MRALLTLIRREFTAYFLSPVAYVTIAGFLLLTGTHFHATMVALTDGGPQGVEYPVQGVFGDREFWLFFLLIPPLLTMRLLAEERGTGTLEMLLTAPVRDWQVVAGKYVGAVLFFAVLALPTLVYVPVLVNLDWATLTPRIDPTPVLTTYLGFLAAAAMFLAIGLYASSLVQSQLVAAMAALLLSLPFVVVAFWQPDLDANSFDARLVTFLSVPEHFRRDFTRGVIDTRHLALYATVAAYYLYRTAVSLEARRLRA